MMLLFAPHHSDERFRAPISGLRSLIAVPDAAAAGTRGGCVVTRAAAAAAVHGRDRREGVNTERRERDDGTSVGHGEGVTVETAKEGEENDATTMEEAKEREEEEDELDGFWVPYGPRRCPRRRRLPPPIPSLVARGALRRTRTGDGRLVIRIVPVVRPECIRARRRREDDSPIVPPLQELTTMTAAREDGVRINVARADDDDAATPAAAGEGVHDVDDAAVAASAPAETLPPRVPSLGCFEEVFKLGSIGSSSSLHQMPSLRMVH